MKINNKSKDNVKKYKEHTFKEKNSFSNNSKTIETNSSNVKYNKENNSFSTLNNISRRDAMSYRDNAYESKRNSGEMFLNHPPIEKGALSQKSKIISGSLCDSISKQIYKSNNNNNHKHTQIINKQNKFLNQFIHKPIYQTNQNSSSSILSQDIQLKFWDENDNDGSFKPSSNHSLNLSKYVIKNNIDSSNNSKIKSNIIDISVENRRLCVEFIKAVSNFKLNKYKNISLLLKEHSLDESILNPHSSYSHNSIKQHNVPVNNNEVPNGENVLKENQPPLLVNYFSKESSLIYTNFIKEMNDNQKEKTQMVNYLMIPRRMNMEIRLPNSIVTKKKQSQIMSLIFLLSPNVLCYLKGIESYVFKWIDINTYCFLGGFDLIKMTSCLIDNEDPTHFLIETFDGEKTRKYKIDANTLEQCSLYVKCLSYLSQLIKCKVFSLKHNKE